MEQPTQDRIDTWKQRIDDSADLKFNAVKWTMAQELRYQHMPKKDIDKVLAFIEGDNIVSDMLKATCKAYNTAFLPTSPEMETFEDIFEMTAEYAQYMAKKEMNDELELECSRKEVVF